MTPRQRDPLIDAMRRAFDGQTGWIDHSLTVLDRAEQILEHEPGDEQTVVAAAILHDVGAAEATRRVGRSSHDLQQQYGPPVARAILDELGMAADVTDHVCRIIASHHSGDMDTPEFRIVWDADWLVNLAGRAGTGSLEELRACIGETFRTPTGRAIAERVYLAAGG